MANVVDNALRHAAGTAVEIHASTHAGRVELRICDHGPGLPRGAAEIVFGPFQRLGATERGDRRHAPGVGLGLWVAKGFVAAMGGMIAAEDTPGGGLTVVISMPAAAQPDTTPAAGEVPVREASP